MKKRSDDFYVLFWGFVGAILILFFVLAFSGCKTSTETEGEVSSMFPPPVESVDAVAPIETPPNQQPIPPSPPVKKPKPKPPTCYPKNVRFDNGQWTAVIPGFAWGETYPVNVMNTSSTCTFTATLTCSVYFEGNLLLSGSCCLFVLGPGESKTINFDFPYPSAVAPPSDLCVLGIAAHN